MQKKELIGRLAEKKILQEALNSNEAEMVAVIGRRRVGKTFLIKKQYENELVFDLTGLQDAPLVEQLDNFAFWLGKHADAKLPVQRPESWLRAFMLLINYLETLDFSQKKVVFLDELSWMATHKSGFLRALGFFWNSWAVNQNIVVVICGSAASWMIQKVVNNRGGLHNRITRRIFLKPFTLEETETFLQNRNIRLNRYQIIQIYMAMGGIPHYLKEIKPNLSAVQNIDALCFSETGLLRTEFERLYPSIFDHADRHIAIIRALGQSHQGLTRNQVIEASKLPNNGNTTKTLEELEQSGFITTYHAFGKNVKDKLYRLTDEYSLFYLRFIERNKMEGQGTWTRLSQTPAYKTWSGYAFENVCLRHVPQIKSALSIGGIYAVSSSFFKKGTKEEPGAQIDLVLDRNDSTISLFEMKFMQDTFSITKSYAAQLQKKIEVFRTTTLTKKQIFLVLIATQGLKSNQHSIGLVDESLDLDALFLS